MQPPPDDFLDGRSQKSNAIPWIIAGGAAIAALALLFAGLLPARSERDEARAALAAAQGQLDQGQDKLKEALKDSETLSEENEKTRADLKAAIAEKEAALKALEEAQKELEGTLQEQITAGDVLVKEVGGELVVDVSDKLLFDKGQAEINEAGQDLLLQVARSMNKLPSQQVFQVGGHTDSQRVRSKELVEKYATNWELSTARATNVVRYLQDKGKVAGRRLVAAGFAQFRPVATNNTKTGRAKNRRIEIVLLRPKG